MKTACPRNPNPEQNQFKCDVCGKLYSRNDALKVSKPLSKLYTLQVVPYFRDIRMIILTENAGKSKKAHSLLYIEWIAVDIAIELDQMCFTDLEIRLWNVQRRTSAVPVLNFDEIMESA